MTDLSNTPDDRLSEHELMVKYGISCVPTDRFHYRSFRYSRLSDALVQAKRDERVSRGG